MSTEEALAFKKEVVKTSNLTKTIVSDFEQYKHLSFLTNDIKTEGTLRFKSPNLIKWQYQKPYKYTAIFKENKLFVDDSGDKNTIDLSANKLFKNFNQLIINSVKGNLFNEDEFTIHYFKLAKFYLVKFIPKNKDMGNFIASFELVFDIKTADVVKVKMIEPSEDYTLIIFKNKQLNTTVLDAEFN
ncbi:outer membrane lipoprotein carrier protein LolA [Polaribacter sp.]|uniref:outer membrane lipoprotein carrier protein LolA n=1 Tax=Polaribacter sp. TaxID=1920175 RepID=UPI003EF9C12F